MKKLSHEEIKAMIGTEFKYVFSNRSDINGIVAAFDPKIGFTCLATDDECSDGYKWKEADKDENGNICLLGYDNHEIKNPAKFHEICFILNSIKHLGYYILNSDLGLGRSYDSHTGGNPACSF